MDVMKMAMEMKMEGSSNVGQEVTDSEELLHQLLRQDREKKKMKTGDDDKEEQEQEQSRCRRLSKLLSQLETVKDNTIEPSKPSTEKKTMTSSSNAVEAGEMDEKDCGSVDKGVEQIFKELRMLRRQNTITH